MPSARSENGSAFTGFSRAKHAFIVGPQLSQLLSIGISPVQESSHLGAAEEAHGVQANTKV
jgi:hypothetical protein